MNKGIVTRAGASGDALRAGLFGHAENLSENHLPPLAPIGGATSHWNTTRMLFGLVILGLAGMLVGCSGLVSGSQDQGFVEPFPSIRGVHPVTGPLNGGTALVLTGVDLKMVETIAIGARLADDVIVDTSAGTIRCTAPPGQVGGFVDVLLTFVGAGTDRLASGYFYQSASISAVTPSVGPLTGGTPITISGGGFEGTVNVTIGSVPIGNLGVNATGTAITCVTPASATGGIVQVEVSSSIQGTAFAPGGFRFDDPLTLTSISPSAGVLVGSTPLTIRGTGFEGTVTVSISGTQAIAIQTNAAETEITCLSPSSLSAGIGDVVVTSSVNGFALLPSAYTYANLPTFTFDTATGLLTGRGPSAVVFGDIEQDGDLDLIVPTADDDLIWAFRATSPGIFAAGVPFPTGQEPTDAVLIDLNFDGNLDLAVTARGSNEVFILLGDGSGTFTPHFGRAVGADPRTLVARDMDLNGRLDLVVASREANQVGVLLGLGDGTFQAVIPYNVAAGPVDLIVADLNRDGELDVAVACEDGRAIEILTGQGFGNLSATTRIPLDARPVSLAVDDIQPDGFADLIVGLADAPGILTLAGGPDLAFTETGRVDPGGVPGDLAMADLDSDGARDVVVTLPDLGEVRVFPAAGNGAYGTPASILTGSSPTRLAVADLDRDGRQDLLVTDPVDFTVNVLKSTTTRTGSDAFDTPVLVFVADSGLEGIAVGDVDRDGDTDMIVCSPVHDGALVLLDGDSAGGLTRTVTLTAGNFPVDVALADLDGDGRLDVVAANRISNTLSVLQQDFDGALNLVATLPVGAGPVRVLPVDLDGDGLLDLVSVDGSSGGISILLGFGSAQFGPLSFRATGLLPSAVVSADFNEDGLADLAVSNRGVSTVSLFLGNGDGTFGFPASFPVGTSPVDLVAGDVNRDGHIDLVTANNDMDTVTVLLMDGFGGVSGTTSLATGSQEPLGLVMEDLERDGDLDLAISHDDSSHVRLMLGDGAGGFISSSTITVGSESSDMVLVDLDHDGRVDLAIGDRIFGQIRLVTHP